MNLFPINAWKDLSSSDGFAPHQCGTKSWMGYTDRTETENGKAETHAAVQLPWLVAKLRHKNTVPNTTSSKYFIYPRGERAEAGQQTAKLLALDWWGHGRVSSCTFNKPRSLC